MKFSDALFIFNEMSFSAIVLSDHNSVVLLEYLELFLIFGSSGEFQRLELLAQSDVLFAFCFEQSIGSLEFLAQQGNFAFILCFSSG